MIDRKLPLDPSQPCWLWDGARDTQGYGILNIDGKRKYRHRIAYQLHVGFIPRGWEIDHVCHSHAVSRGECPGGKCIHRTCWNPAHLEAVSSRENSLRGNHPLFSIARSQVCRRGHDLTVDDNVYTRTDGRRRCRLCLVQKRRERNAARAA